MEEKQKLAEVQIDMPIIEESVKQNFLASETAKNDHYLILGKSGEGKTVLTKQILAQLINKDRNACLHLIDLHGEYTELFTKECTWSAVERGLPFDWLKKTTDLPWDIHIDEKLCELKEAAPSLGPVQLGELRKLLSRCKENITNKELSLVLRKHLSQSSQFQLEPLILLLRARTNVKNPYGQSILHDLSRLSNKVSQSIYAISLVRHIFNHAKFSDINLPHFMIFEEASRLIKAEGTMDLLYQEGRKYNVNGVLIAQSWTTVPKSVKHNSAIMLLFPSAAKAVLDSTHSTDNLDYIRPVYKFNGTSGEWLETEISINENQAILIGSSLSSFHPAERLKTHIHNDKHKSISEKTSEPLNDVESTREHKYKPLINDNKKHGCEASEATDTALLAPPNESSLYRAKWAALIISIIGVVSCLAISINKVVV
ncbi:MAG: ATP-binding protein [Colwellia sp.]|nr:ATP-binding protein [Colwellia sp.]